MIKIKIGSGSLKGRVLLHKISNNNSVRPTSSFVKGVVFNILKHNNISNIDIKNSFVADFFCGSGAIGFEFISCGAKNCTFFDKSRENIQNIEENAKKLNISEKVITQHINVSKNTSDKAKINSTFDIIYIDPPYKEENLIDETLFLIQNLNLLKQNGIIVIESENKIKIKTGFIIILERKVQKKKILTFLKKL